MLNKRSCYQVLVLSILIFSGCKQRHTAATVASSDQARIDASEHYAVFGDAHGNTLLLEKNGKASVKTNDGKAFVGTYTSNSDSVSVTAGGKQKTFNIRDSWNMLEDPDNPLAFYVAKSGPGMIAADESHGIPEKPIVAPPQTADDGGGATSGVVYVGEVSWDGRSSYALMREYCRSLVNRKGYSFVRMSSRAVLYTDGRQWYQCYGERGGNSIEIGSDGAQINWGDVRGGSGTPSTRRFDRDTNGAQIPWGDLNKSHRSGKTCLTVEEGLALALCLAENIQAPPCTYLKGLYDSGLRVCR